MAPAPGAHLGPYEVAAPFGVDGMGEVYKATDTNAKRAVASVRAAMPNDPEYLACFQCEAEGLAGLSHPDVTQIHGLDKSDNTTALVELVDDPTFGDSIARGAIPIDVALPIAKQFAESPGTARTGHYNAQGGGRLWIRSDARYS